jgi:hypothetical protein
MIRYFIFYGSMPISESASGTFQKRRVSILVKLVLSVFPWRLLGIALSHGFGVKLCILFAETERRSKIIGLSRWGRICHIFAVFFIDFGR